MIKTKQDLKEFIDSDLKMMNLMRRKLWKQSLRGNCEILALAYYIIALRKYEYAINNKEGIWGMVRYLVRKRQFQKLRMKRNIYISPNVFDKGLHLVHMGYVWIDSSSKIGKNCTVLPRVLIGKKRPGIKPPCIFIGDNCYIGTGSTILGPITIGNNVTIAAGSIVTKDIPDNCIVAGNPAKIIKEKDI